MRNSRRKRKGLINGGGNWIAQTASWQQFLGINAGQAAFATLVSAVPTAPGIGAIPVGRDVVRKVDAWIDFLGNSSALASFAVSVGLYKARYDRVSSSFNAQFLSNSLDANEDNWLHVWARQFIFPIQTALTVPGHISHDVHWKGNVSIGQGEALYLVIGNSVNSGTSIGVGVSVRVQSVKAM